MSKTTKELESLIEHLQGLTLSSPREEVFQVITATEAMLNRLTDDDAPYKRNAQRAVDTFFQPGVRGSGCQKTLGDSLLGIIMAFKSEYEAGYIVDTGVVTANN